MGKSNHVPVITSNLLMSYTTFLGGGGVVVENNIKIKLFFFNNLLIYEMTHKWLLGSRGKSQNEPVKDTDNPPDVDGAVHAVGVLGERVDAFRDDDGEEASRGIAQSIWKGGKLSSGYYSYG